MRTLKADLSDEAFEGWTHWFDHNGVTAASLLEAIGLELRENPFWQDSSGVDEPGRKIIDRARQIQAERRRRR